MILNYWCYNEDNETDIYLTLKYWRWVLTCIAVLDDRLGEKRKANTGFNLPKNLAPPLFGPGEPPLNTLINCQLWWGFEEDVLYIKNVLSRMPRLPSDAFAQVVVGRAAESAPSPCPSESYRWRTALRGDRKITTVPSRVALQAHG